MAVVVAETAAGWWWWKPVEAVYAWHDLSRIARFGRHTRGGHKVPSFPVVLNANVAQVARALVATCPQGLSSILVNVIFFVLYIIILIISNYKMFKLN